MQERKVQIKPHVGFNCDHLLFRQMCFEKSCGNHFIQWEIRAASCGSDLAALRLIETLC